MNFKNSIDGVKIFISGGYSLCGRYRALTINGPQTRIFLFNTGLREAKQMLIIKVATRAAL